MTNYCKVQVQITPFKWIDLRGVHGVRLFICIRDAEDYIEELQLDGALIYRIVGA